VSTAIQPAPAVPWLPTDNGYLTANGDPGLIDSTAVLVAGTLYLVKLKARGAGIPLAAVHFSVNAAGVGASSGSFGGAYSSAGQLLSGSADIGAALLASGDLPIPLSVAGQAIPPGGFVWAALLVNLATTQPTMNRFTGSLTSGANVGLTAATFAYATNGTGLVALPGSINPAANVSGTGLTLWAAST
jgi:hypothetical protein